MLFSFWSGYAAHLVGKWHLGFYKWPYVPTNRGFDTAYGFWDGAEGHFDHKRNGVVDFRNGTEPVLDLDGKYATYEYVKVGEFLRYDLGLYDPLLCKCRLDYICADWSKVQHLSRNTSSTVLNSWSSCVFLGHLAAFSGSGYSRNTFYISIWHFSLCSYIKVAFFLRRNCSTVKLSKLQLYI